MDQEPVAVSMVLALQRSSGKTASALAQFAEVIACVV